MKAVLLGLLLAGCASVPQLPPCEQVQMVLIPTSNGNLYAFSETGIRALVNMIQRVQDRKCRIKGEEKES